MKLIFLPLSLTKKTNFWCKMADVATSDSRSITAYAKYILSLKSLIMSVSNSNKPLSLQVKNVQDLQYELQILKSVCMWISGSAFILTKVTCSNGGSSRAANKVSCCPTQDLFLLIAYRWYRLWYKALLTIDKVISHWLYTVLRKQKHYFFLQLTPVPCFSDEVLLWFSSVSAIFCPDKVSY